MNRIFSNRGNGDFVANPFNKLIGLSSHIHLAAPYFTCADPILRVADDGKSVQLLVGLNATTSPDELRKVHQSGVAVRYLTNRFHAKIYIFDNAALLGSSNLTDGGLCSNREAVICLDRPEDTDAIEEIRVLFFELWGAGQVLTKETLDIFAEKHNTLLQQARNPNSEIERAVGKAEPPNISVTSHKKSKKRICLEQLQRRVYEEYSPAFNEVKAVLEKHGFWRDDLIGLGADNETNRFLNYVRETHVIGDDAWQTAPLRSQEERSVEITRLGSEWVDTPASANKVPEYFEDWLDKVARVFGTADAVDKATKDDITTGLMSLHAFTEQLRFVKGGEENLPPEFWKRNHNDTERVRSTLSHLLYGPDHLNFTDRLHDILYDQSMKLTLFGTFCALELCGTVNPEECPPVNGRIAKALRYLGFDVQGT